MFTALFVTRTLFEFLLRKGIIKNHIVMLQLIRKPNIDWMKYRAVFFTISGIMAIGGLTIFLTRGESKYDIEFTGGTSVQINLRQGVTLDRQQVEDLIHKKGEELNNKAIASASVYSVGNTGRQYELNTTETNKTRAVVAFSAGQWTVDSVAAAIRKAETAQQTELSNLVVTPDKSAQSFAVQHESVK